MTNRTRAPPEHVPDQRYIAMTEPAFSLASTHARDTGQCTPDAFLYAAPPYQVRLAASLGGSLSVSRSSTVIAATPAEGGWGVA